MSGKASGYNHTEAFCLMYYACKHCKHVERIWNSRDGVTPAGGVRCPSCEETYGLSHVAWSLDECRPDWKLRPGQRFFRDGTVEEAIAIMERRKRKFAEQGHHVTDESFARIIAGIKAGADSSEFRKGWPMTDRHPDPVIPT